MKHIKRVAKKVTKKAQAKKKVEPEKTADATVSPESEKIMDVARPGTSMADAGSKPIIAAKGAPVQDPMVTPQQMISKDAVPEDTLMTTTEEKSEIRASKNRIEPLHEDGVVESPEEQAAEDKKSEGTNTEGASDEATDLSLQDQQQNAKSAEEQAAEKRQEQANALVDSKAYFLPVNSVKKRRSMRVILFTVVFIFIVLVGGLLALDAGIVDIGVTPPTNFIDD